MDPVILFFGLGVAAGLLRSELRLPPAIYDLLSTLLLLYPAIRRSLDRQRGRVLCIGQHDTRSHFLYARQL